MKRVFLFLIVLGGLSCGRLEKIYISKNKINAIIIEDNDVGVILATATDEKIYIRYYENENENYEINDNNERIVIKKIRKEFKFYKRSRDIYLEILVPKNFDGMINVSTKNNYIKINNISTTFYIKAKTSNGRVNLENVNGDTVTIKTSNDSINISNVSIGNEISIITSNGDILGDIIGNKGDFFITSKTSNKEISLNDMKKLYAKTSNGSIKIDFIGTEPK